ncbi:MAG: Wzz/FepE/Etk N-terminal domain-containing protein, partial [Bacteroidetes bacterium]|nr:Wzz/FepE/Etk N-terminal domain-containing protein [Bacteroidota bacterium]
MAKKRITQLNSDFDAKLFAIIARKNFYWIIMMVTAAILLSYLYLRYTAPTFQAHSVIKIGVVNNANAVLNINNSDMLNGLGITQTQLAGDVELLKSRVIIARAINSMPLNVSYYAKGTVLENELYQKSPFQVE